MNPRPVHRILYDDACPLCTFQMRTLTWLDWRNCLKFLPLSDPLSAQAAPRLDREQLLEAIHCLASDGRIYRGARCIRFVSLRLPLLVPLGVFLWLPGVIPVAEVIYRWVSRNRHLLSRWFGCKGACAWLPARKKE